MPSSPQPMRRLEVGLTIKRYKGDSNRPLFPHVSPAQKWSWCVPGSSCQSVSLSITRPPLLEGLPQTGPDYLKLTATGTSGNQKHIYRTITDAASNRWHHQQTCLLTAGQEVNRQCSRHQIQADPRPDSNPASSLPFCLVSDIAN